MEISWVKWPLIGAAALVAVDQVIKVAVLARPPDITIIPGFFAIRFATNTGAAFSLFRDFPQAVTILGILILAVLVGYWWHRGRAAPVLERIAFALLMGGALGNLIDRVRLGYVVDYLDVFVGAYHWPMFNLADVAVSIGRGVSSSCRFASGPALRARPARGPARARGPMVAAERRPRPAALKNAPDGGGRAPQMWRLSAFVFGVLFRCWPPGASASRVDGGSGLVPGRGEDEGIASDAEATVNTQLTQEGTRTMTQRNRAMLIVLMAMTLSWPLNAMAGGEEGVEFVGADEVRRLQQSARRVAVIDVRSAEEFRESRIKGAVNVPVTEIERRFGEIPRQGLVVLY